MIESENYFFQWIWRYGRECGLWSD